MDDQQRARELLAKEWRKLAEDAPADMLESGCELPPLVAASIAAITTALRAAPNAVALRVAMETLEQIANAPTDQGAKFNAAGTVAFLTTQGAVGRAAPEGWSFQRQDDGSIIVTAECYGSVHVRPDDSDSIAAAMLHLLADDLAARPQGV